jgi:putative transposase
MPWSETSPMDQKTKFIADYLRHSLPISELCTDYGISRKTGYKWIDRYLHDGPQGLEDRSTKPYTAPNRTPEHIVQALIDLRSHHPTWGWWQVAQRHSTPASRVGAPSALDGL